MKKLVLCLLALVMMFSVACNSYKVTTGSGTMNFKDAAIIEENEEYKLMLEDGMYCVFFNDDNDEAVANFGPVSQQPEISNVSDNLLKINVSSGSTISWYYDIENKKLSEVYDNVACENDSMVAVIDGSIITVYNIFNSEEYQEISDFSNPLDMVSEPIISAEFSEDGSELSVTYLNDTSTEVTENIKIDITK